MRPAHRGAVRQSCSSNLLCLVDTHFFLRWWWESRGRAWGSGEAGTTCWHNSFATYHNSLPFGHKHDPILWLDDYRLWRSCLLCLCAVCEMKPTAATLSAFIVLFCQKQPEGNQDVCTVCYVDTCTACSLFSCSYVQTSKQRNHRWPQKHLTLLSQTKVVGELSWHQAFTLYY